MNAAALFIFVCSALVYSQEGYAQSRLQPGDILFTGVDAAENTFSLVSFKNIPAGTALYVSTQASAAAQPGSTPSPELEILFGREVERGTEILFPLAGDGENITLSGQFFSFEGRTRLYLYRKESGQTRFLSGVAWGTDDKARRLPAMPDMVPEELREPEINFISLGSGSGYAYSIRNGISGTVNMLRRMLLTETNWQAGSSSFTIKPELKLNILEPPVIQFAGNLSTAGADADLVRIKVAIFEHDGSKLLVNVSLNELASTLSSADFSGFSETRINFTGIIGDSEEEIKLPLTGRPEFSGPVTAIFELNELSEGRFGDFVTHTLLLEEEKEASVRMQTVRHNSGVALILYNPENRDIDVGGWQLKQGRKTLTLPGGLMIKSRGKLILTPDKNFSVSSDNEDIFIVQEKEAAVFGEPGKVALYTVKKQKVDEIEKLPQNKTVSAAVSEITANTAGNTLPVQQMGAAVSSQSGAAGGSWLSLPYHAGMAGANPELDFYYWSRQDYAFKPVSAGETFSVQPAVVKVLDNEKVSALKKELAAQDEKEHGDTGFSFSVASACSGDESRDHPACGLNYLINTTGSQIQAGELIKQLAARMEPARKPVIFAESAQGIHSLLDEEYIAPGQSFWIQIHEQTDPVTVYAEFDAVPKEKELPAEETPAGFSFNLTSEQSSRKVTFLMGETGPGTGNRYTLDAAVPPVFPGADDDLVFAVRSGTSFLSTITRKLRPAETVEIPLVLSAGTAQNLTLGINDWNDIPEGIRIELEDLAENRIYELGPGWTAAISAAGRNNKTSSSSERLAGDEELRFLLRMQPAAAENNLGEQTGQTDRPDVITLNQNYPNPFNPVTTISFYLPDEAEVKLTIFNVVGQPVAELINSKLGSGTHRADWDASEIPSGMYIYQLEAGTKVMTRKMMLVK